MIKYVLFALGIAVCGTYSLAIDDPTDFPVKATIEVLHIPDYTIPGTEDILTNCYLIEGPTGQVILIDPADQLDMVTDKKLLVDKTTGISTVVATKDLTDYTVVGDHTVKSSKTGQERLVYDQFRTTDVGTNMIMKALAAKHLTLKYIVVSHGHLDHFGALTSLKKKTGAQVLMYGEDLRGLDGAKLKAIAGKPLIGYPKDSYRIIGVHTPVDRLLYEGDLITLDGMTLQVISTPGHCPSCICLRTRQAGKTILFSGDTLLHWYNMLDGYGGKARDEQGNYITGDTGRTNFIDGSGDEDLLYRMIREKLLVLPDDTVVYPGHNEPTTIGEEKKYSPARIVKDKPL